MNKLFYYDIREYINGEETYSGGVHIYHYGEPEDTKDVVFSDFNNLYDSDLHLLDSYRDVSLFRKKRIIRYQPNNCCTRSISEKDFSSYKLSAKVKEITHKVTMQELMERLSAEEFVLWCKDHGMNTHKSTK